MRHYQTAFSRNSRRSASRAFSLIELMIAVVITTIIFAVLFTGIRSTFALIDASRENMRATQILVSRLEGLRLCTWSADQLFNTNVVPPTFTDSFYPLGLRGSTNYGTTYFGQITINTNFALNPSATYNNNLAKVTVTVSWSTRNSTTTNLHTRSMDTYVAKYGVQNYVFSQ